MLFLEACYPVDVSNSAWSTLIHELYLVLILFFQEVIRSSVTQDHSSSQTKPVAPSLEIKLPIPTSGKIERDSPLSTTPMQKTEVSRERDLLATAASIHSNVENIDESEDDEEDWDAFQSFTASTTAAKIDTKVESTAEGPDLVEDSSAHESSNKKDDFDPSQPLGIVKVSNEAEDPEKTGEQNLVSDSGGETKDMKVVHEFQTNNDKDHQHHQEIEEKKIQETEDGAVTSEANKEIASDIQLAEDTKGSVKLSSAEDYERRNESLDNKIYEVLSTDVQQIGEQEGSSEEHVVK